MRCSGGGGGPGHGRRSSPPGKIDRLKRDRAVATRYDKLAVRYEAILHIAVINDWPLTSP